MGHEDWQLEDLVNAVQLDQALTGRLLGAANSVWSGAQAPVVDVEHAIMRLGPGTLLALAVHFPAKPDSGAPRVRLIDNRVLHPHPDEEGRS